MKKLNRYLSIFALVVVSGTPLLNKPVIATEAALTAPANYQYSFQHDASYGEYLLVNTVVPSAPKFGFPAFNREADSTYFNYFWDSSTDLIDGDSISSILPSGLNVSMRFNRSNTNWSVGSGTYADKYFAITEPIGSNTTVGTVSNKFSISFSNFTNRGYQLLLDTSSNVAMFAQYVVSGIFTEDDAYYVTNSNYNNFLISPGYTVTLRSASTSGSRYFDAWYLRDLGVNSTYTDGYDNGYDEGYDDGYANSASPLWDGVELTVGVILNFVLFIMTLSVFDISLLSIGVVLLSVLSLVWILKALRG
jgi:hypothetical protein